MPLPHIKGDKKMMEVTVKRTIYVDTEDIAYKIIDEDIDERIKGYLENCSFDLEDIDIRTLEDIETEVLKTALSILKERSGDEEEG